ncbi:MAG: hypothetical protein J5960_01860 [Desulfovibrio sp.]|nr:hypothetical protein [Desulfovibrio sp.]
MRTFLFSLLATVLVLGANAAAAPKDAVVKELQRRGEIDKIQCDKIVSDTVHVGDTYNFWVDFTAKDLKVRVSDVNYWFWTDKDYNGSDAVFSLSPTKEAEKANGIVDNTTLRLVESTDYHIRTLPDHPSEENILFKAEILFNQVMPDGTLSPEQGRFVQCMRCAVKK